MVHSRRRQPTACCARCRSAHSARTSGPSVSALLRHMPIERLQLCPSPNLVASRPLIHCSKSNRRPAAEVSPVNMVLVRLLLLALLPLLANCQPIPPQCNPAKFAQPTMVTFLGPVRSVKVGAPPPPAPPPACRHRPAATGLPSPSRRCCEPGGCWQIHAGHIPSLGSCHCREHPTSRRPQTVCCQLLLTGRPPLLALQPAALTTTTTCLAT